MKKKNRRKDFATLGKEIYGFDLQSERYIYDYLCCFRMKKKKLRQLDNEHKFNSYKQWEKYIKGKYSGYDSETLIEFSRYLNQRIRIVNSSSEYWKLCAPVILTLILSKLVEVLYSSEPDLNGAPLAAILFLITLLIVFLIFSIWQVVSPIFDDYWDGYMLKDYKEIIDSMIED